MNFTSFCYDQLKPDEYFDWWLEEISIRTLTPCRAVLFIVHIVHFHVAELFCL
jgi:hypothetical protein